MWLDMAQPKILQNDMHFLVVLCPSNSFEAMPLYYLNLALFM